jgi:protocatechuate 3,4-dioxygenase beta subunit
VGDVLLFVGSKPHPVGPTAEAGRGVATVDPAAPLTLRLLAADGRRLETQLRPTALTSERPRRLSLPDRLLISGRLLDADTRRPIGGGLVWDGSDPDEASTSDGAGGFVLGGPAGHRLDVSAGAPGYLFADAFEFQLNDDGRPGPTLALRPAAAVAGTVTDGDGEPVTGAELELVVRRDPSMMRIEIGGTRSLARSRSGPSGRFRISPIDPEQSYELRVRADGYAPASEVLTGLEPYRTRAGLRIALTRGQTLTGTVVDSDGNPLRDAAVRLAAAAAGRGLGGMRLTQPGGDESRFGADSDDAGRFTVAGLPVGKFDLTVSRSGFAQRTVPAVELKQDDDATDVGEVVLEPGEKIHGIVIDRDRQPVEGAEIELQESGPMMMMALPGGAGSGETEPDAVTDPAGWFTLEDLGREERHNFTVRRTGFVEARLNGIQLPRVEPLEITLQPASKVSGRVLDSDGEPVAGARIEMSRSRKMEMGGAAIAVMMMTGETADDEGRFVFEDQEPGVLSLRALASGYQEAKLDNVEVPKGEDLSGLELTLPPGAILQGRVLAPDGRAAIQATVRLAGEDNEMMRIDGAFSDGAGYYRLEGLAPRAVSVEATHSDYPRTVKDVELDEGLNVLDLQFEGGHEVAGRVSDTTGGAVNDALVRLVPAGRSWGGPEVRTRADGSFMLPGVQDGDYRVWVEAHGYAPTGGEQQVVVAGEPVAGLEVVLDTGVSLSGTISGVDPEQFGRVSVEARGESVRGYGSSGVDYEGRYRVENLLPGSYSVLATLADSANRAEGQITLDQGVPEIQLDLQFTGGLTLGGRALQGDRAVAGATLYAEAVEFRHSGWTQTDDQGAFTLAGLEPGRYRLNLRNWQTGLAYNEEIELATSREIELHVPLASVAGRIRDTADRQPLAGVALVLESTTDAEPGAFPTHTAVTDSTGRFRLAHIADGNWRLAAEKRGYAAVSRAVDVRNGRSVGDLDLSMDATEGLTLEVRQASGTVPGDVRVAVLDPAGSTLVSGNYSTGENGRVRLTSVPPGSFKVIVSAAGSATAQFDAQAPGASIPVVLQPACALVVLVPDLQSSNTVATVRLLDGQNNPFRALDWEGRPRSEWQIGSGRTEFASLPPGSWEVSVSAADGRTWQEAAVTTASERTEVVLQ